MSGKVKNGLADRAEMRLHALTWSVQVRVRLLLKKEQAKQ